MYIFARNLQVYLKQYRIRDDRPFRIDLMLRGLQRVLAQPSSVLMLATERVTPGAISRTGERR